MHVTLVPIFCRERGASEPRRRQIFDQPRYLSFDPRSGDMIEGLRRLWRCRRNGTDARFWPRRAELGPVDETGTGGFRASKGTGRISGMLDPATCAGMVLGVPRVTSKPFDHVPRPGIERQIARLIKNLPATRF